MADYAFHLRSASCGGHVGSNPSYELREIEVLSKWKYRSEIQNVRAMRNG